MVSSEDKSKTEELYNISFETIDEESDNAWYSLIQNLSKENLIELEGVFKKNEAGGLNRTEFLDAICDIYGNSKYSFQSLMLFDDISENSKNNITWNDFLDFLIDNLNPKVPAKVTLHLSSIDTVPHTKNECVVKIVLIETEKYFCYAMISKHGRVGLYDGNLNFLTSYHVIMTREDVTRTEEERRRRNRWVTDAIFCRDVLMFVVTNSARTITIYEASGLKHEPYWLIVSTPNIIEGLAYKCCDRDNSESILFTGDCYGEVIAFYFKQPKTGFLRRKCNDNISIFYWAELPNEISFIIKKNFGKLHQNSIKDIKYVGETDSIVTCCRSPNCSLIIKHVENKRKTNTYKMLRGTSSFAISSYLKLLITGSDNGIIRFWNSIIVTKPTAILMGHSTDIVDIQIMENLKLFLSLSRDGIFKLWDVTDQQCLQTIKIKFPAFGVHGKLIEWGKNCIYPGPRRKSVDNFKVDENQKKTCFDIDDITDMKEDVKKDINKADLHIWERSNILVTCCNYIANFRTNFGDPNIESTVLVPILQPPPLQNSVLIPSSWRLQDYQVTSSERKDVSDFDIKEHLKELEFILRKDLLEGDGLKSDINYKIAILESKKLQMQKHVAQGAPYLALDLYDIEELKLPDLPMPKDKKLEAFVEQTKKILEDATIRDQIFSEPTSSSRSKSSSRSSIVELPL